MPVLRVRTEFELQDVVEALDQPAGLVARDFALMTIAARLTERYPGELCFKGGFVLRHVHGHQRFSRDIDATRTKPPKHKLDAESIAQEILRASGTLTTFKPEPPETDSRISLDFNRIAFSGPFAEGLVSVEISYREDVHDPQIERVGPPYYEPFPITVLSLDEIVAEKLRALCQRTRATDLADIAMVLRRAEHDPAHARELVAEKGSKRGQRPRPGVRLHTLEHPPEDTEIRRLAGVPVTAPERTILDALQTGTQLEQVGLATAQAIDRGLTTPRRLRSAAESRPPRVHAFIDRALQKAPS